jgi:hypothetical protein
MLCVLCVLCDEKREKFINILIYFTARGHVPEIAISNKKNITRVYLDRIDRIHRVND